MGSGSLPLYKATVNPSDGVHRLSVLIYSYNRHNYLRRQILYWAEKPVDLLIADGSQDPLAVTEAERLGQFRLIYHHVPGPRNVNLRMKWLASNASTPYVIFVDDQDTFLWTAAIRLMDILDKSNQYASASGAMFCRYEGYQYWHYVTDSFDLDQAGAGARVIEGWGRSNPLARCAYALMRSSAAREVYECRPQVDFDNESSSDLLFFVSVMVAGKHLAASLPALWRWDGSQPRGVWRSPLLDGEVSLDKLRLNGAIDKLCTSYGVGQADRDVVYAIIAGVWAD